MQNQARTLPTPTIAHPPHSQRKAHEARGIVREYLEVAMWGMPLFLFFVTFIAQNFKIPTQSMENSLLIGDHLTVNKFLFRGSASPIDRALSPTRQPKRGDVVVFKWPGDVRQHWVKRLIGLPGDHLEIIDDQLFLDGAPLDEDYAFYKGPYSSTSERDPNIAYRPKDFYSLKPGLKNAVTTMSQSISAKKIIDTTHRNLLINFSGHYPKAYRQLVERLLSSEDHKIPEGYYFVMGDNRNRSMDSRSWGLVPKELLEGRAYWVWWSYGEDEGTHVLQGLDLAKVYLRYPFTFWTRTHWEESFRRIR